MLVRCLAAWRGVLPLSSAGGAADVATRLYHATAWSAASLPALEDGATSFATDLTFPASWYPQARALQRRVVLHLGPTNSGKTHQALEALKQAGSGVYCGPLRLLAWQVAERMNEGGLPCSLVTGQERREVPGARHVACTVEMASLGRPVDVAVLDEVQMMGDRSRGWAFTRALLGLPARELHVCGDPAALPLLEQLCAEAGDALEVRQYERLSPLRPARRALGCLSKVGRGDCVVAFSRREVHAIRRQVEASGKHKCCVVYGALPPEARSQQAVLFNQPRTGYNVLAASDAVGMGLNLNIRRVVFTRLSKFDGLEERPLTAAETKQIAGRAGRFGSRFPDGVVTTLHAADMPALHAALGQPPEPLQSACIFPSFHQLATFASQRPEARRLHEVLDLFASEALLARHFFFAHFEDVRTLAVMLKHLPLSLREAYAFCLAPCDPGDEPVAAALLALATWYSRRRLVTPALLTHPPLALAQSETQLQQLEATHRIYDLYCWLAYRFQDAFAGGEQAAAARALCARLIDESIRRMPPWARDSSVGSSSRNEAGSDESESDDSGAGGGGGSSSSSIRERGSIWEGGGRSSGRRGAAAGAGSIPAAKRQGRREQQPVETWQEVLAEARSWAKENMHGRGEVITDSSSSEDEEEEGWLVAERRKRKRAYAKRRRGRG